MKKIEIVRDIREFGKSFFYIKWFILKHKRYIKSVSNNLRIYLK